MSANSRGSVFNCLKLAVSNKLYSTAGIARFRVDELRALGVELLLLLCQFLGCGDKLACSAL